MQDKIIQVSGFGVDLNVQNNFILVALTKSGKVLLSEGDCKWTDVSPSAQQAVVADAPKCGQCDWLLEVTSDKFCGNCGRQIRTA